MREVCEHGNEPNNCRECEAIFVINQLLNVMPVFPKSGDNILGYREKYNRAIKLAKEYVLK